MKKKNHYLYFFKSLLLLSPVYFICSGTFASGYVFKYFGYYGIFGSVAGI